MNRINYQAQPVPGVHTVLLDLKDIPTGSTVPLITAPKGWQVTVLSQKLIGLDTLQLRLLLDPPPIITLSIGAE